MAAAELNLSRAGDNSEYFACLDCGREISTTAKQPFCASCQKIRDLVSTVNSMSVMVDSMLEQLMDIQMESLMKKRDLS